MFCVEEDEISLVISIDEYEEVNDVTFSPYEKSILVDAGKELGTDNFADIIDESVKISNGSSIDPLFSTCPSTFNGYTQTGAGYTIEIKCDRNIHVFSYTDIVQYNIENICIASGEFEIDEDDNQIPIGGNTNTRKQLTAQAFDNARVRLYNINKSRHENELSLLSQLEYRNQFINALKDELKFVMTGTAVSVGECSGDVGISRPKSNYLGICLPRCI